MIVTWNICLYCGKNHKSIESSHYPCYCISPNVGRYYGLVTGPPPAMEATMEAEATMAMEAAAMEAVTERF